MAELGKSQQARLRRQIYTTLRFGFPLTLLGGAICAGAVFVIGLDAQGWFVFACGLIVVVAGGAMLLLAIGTTFLFAEAAARARLRKRRTPKAKRAAEEAATVSLPTAPVISPAVAAEPPPKPGGPGPLVF